MRKILIRPLEDLLLFKCDKKFQVIDGETNKILFKSGDEFTALKFMVNLHAERIDKRNRGLLVSIKRNDKRPFTGLKQRVLQRQTEFLRYIGKFKITVDTDLFGKQVYSWFL